MGTAIFTRRGWLHTSARCVGYELGTIADAKHGKVAAKTGKVGLEGLFIIN